VRRSAPPSNWQACLFWWRSPFSPQGAELRFAFDTDESRQSGDRRPYFYIRHPFYASYIVFWIGWGIATWSIWAVVPVAGIVAIYTIAALDEERKFSRTALADAYEAYRARTGLFLAASGRQPAKAAEAGCAMTDIGRQCRRFL